ncbi:MAG: type II toxin-antitoxin system RelE/ParE family toxin [Candidatus Methanomethylophilaceae archaeon]|nr:type II toxin-antitoxin system RelE/ParE family toxin [Candidatus Methanomethylophilaceae archaeon]
MSDYTVEVSGDAKSDITSIYRYIKNELMNETAAIKFIEDTDEVVTSLESFPYSHMVRPGSKLFGGLEKRQYPYRENYMMFYVIIEKRKLVRVIKVAYAPSNLGDE